jgi:hypothetical protein
MKTTRYLVLIFTSASLLAAELPDSSQDQTPTGALLTEEAQLVANQWANWMVEGTKASEVFLKAIDQENYEDSWNQTSVITKLRLRSRYWIKNLENTRKPLGKVKFREMESQKPSMDPPNLPKGPYMVIYYNTSFEHSSDSGELITLRLESDGQWKVLTYQVTN